MIQSPPNTINNQGPDLEYLSLWGTVHLHTITVSTENSGKFQPYASLCDLVNVAIFLLGD
jgi:hypothetical protein